MKLIIQRVLTASVSVDNKLVNTINKGLLIFVGFHANDSIEDIVYLTNKVINLRIFEDENNKMNLSIKDINGEILSISQFTLYANTKKGNRPSFIDSLEPIKASKYYEIFNNFLNENIKTKTGIFGADMKINLINDGPVTIIIDSKEK